MTTGERTVLPFEFVGGHVALDFTNTVSWGGGDRHRSEERLLSYDQLLKWVEQARLPIDVALLEQRASVQPHAAARALNEALELRSELHEVFLARSRARSLPKGLVDRINERLAGALAHLELRETQEATGIGLAWRVAKLRSLDAPLHWIVWEAAAVLTADETVQQCANPNCGWVFLDRSRRGNRRWCDMAVCGSRHKARTHYRRQRQRAYQ